MADEVSRAEDDLLLGDFAACAAACRAVLKRHLDEGRAATAKLEIAPQSRQEVPAEIKAAILFLQALFETGEPANSSDMQLLDRFLRLNGPLPFELVLAWLNLKSHLGQHELVKEKLEAFMGMYAERVKRGGVATPEMCAQYAALAQIYTVQTLPRLGEVDGAQRFLAIHNNNILLSREKRQELLHALNEEIEASESLKTATGGDISVDGSAEAATPGAEASTPSSAASTAAGGSPSSAAGTGGSSASRSGMRTPQQGGLSASRGGRKSSKNTTNDESNPADDDDNEPALVLTKDQVLALVVTSAAAAALFSQRKRISATASSLAESVGNMLFGGT
ncbi:Hypothetical Protein FCC1311_035142 [Hondaea fermentalgiana]|uniref:Uncharacterized protein n=1 Tax=Hondaea fermentalgiana TaxID=2315210 RepID=A0A2R5G8B0_9STRA|nr:Hypothetical Protein FCC1311_035142 [Hondaea fermentalgiana]|eukprot:GBG27292.1 Hypothetical Protein FCC1311_035142 [Hondaea fermentalgiana]